MKDLEMLNNIEILQFLMVLKGHLSWELFGPPLLYGGIVC